MARTRLVLLVSILSGLAALLPGCAGYYPTWHYAPGQAIHELHFSPASPGSQGGEATIRVAARVVGILRPAGGQPRRVHVHLEVDNRDPQPATLDPNLVRVTPSGALSLSPDAGAAVVMAPNERRGIEIFFPLPDPVTLPNTALLELEVSWTVKVGDRELPSKARFFRAARWYGDPYVYDPWGYGGGYYGGYGWPYRGPFWGPYWGYGTFYSHSSCR